MPYARSSVHDTYWAGLKPELLTGGSGATENMPYMVMPALLHYPKVVHPSADAACPKGMLSLEACPKSTVCPNRL